MWKGAHVCPGSGQKTWHRSHPPAPCGAHPHGPTCPPEAGPAGQEASQHPACPPGLSSKASLPRAVSQQAALAGGADTRAAATGTQRCGPGGPCGEAQAGLVFPSPLSPQSHVWLSPAGLVEVRAEQRGRGRVSVDRAGLPSLVSLWAELPAPQLPAAGREATGSALRGLGRRIARTHVGCFLACGAVDAGRARMEVAAPAPAPGPVRAAEGPRPVPPSPGAARSPRVPAGHAPEPLRVPGGPA